MKVVNMSTKSKVGEEKSSSKNFLNILKGSLIAIGLSMILLLIMAVVFTYSNISESSMPVITVVISAISILAGSIVSTKKLEKMGLLNGAIVGLIYILILYIISSATIVGFRINLKMIIMSIFAILSGMVGGIIGVNI